MTEPLDLPAAHTAVLVIDMQNDNIHPDGAFTASGAADHARAPGAPTSSRASTPSPTRSCSTGCA